MNSGREWIDKNSAKLIDIRRWLHMNPEIGFDEYKTSKYLQELLQKSNYNISR